MVQSPGQSQLKIARFGCFWLCFYINVYGFIIYTLLLYDDVLSYDLSAVLERQVEFIRIGRLFVTSVFFFASTSQWVYDSDMHYLDNT